MIKLKSLLMISGASLFLAMGQPSYASQSQMNETLNRIQRLLNQINPLINLAESQQDNNVRVKFQFDTLRKDISSIQEGINQALRQVTIQPRLVEPLSGDYLPEDESLVSQGGSKDQHFLQEDKTS